MDLLLGLDAKVSQVCSFCQIHQSVFWLSAHCCAFLVLIATDVPFYCNAVYNCITTSQSTGVGKIMFTVMSMWNTLYTCINIY